MSNDDVKVVKKRGRKPKDKPETSTKGIEEYVNANMVLHIPLNDAIFDDGDAADGGDACLVPFDKNMRYAIEFSKDSATERYATSVGAGTGAGVGTATGVSGVGVHNTRRSYDTNQFFMHGSTPEPFQHCCFWCTESFSSSAIGLPYNVVRNDDPNSQTFKYKYLVYGYFCGFGCAAAYNYAQKDSRVNDRFTLLSNMREDVYGTVAPIVFAPPREMLRKFGGPLTIDEFRQRCQTQVQYQVIVPPLMSMRCQIEEFYGSLYKKADTPAIHLDDERVMRAQNNIEKLKLRRTTPAHTKNNIESSMGIRIQPSAD